MKHRHSLSEKLEVLRLLERNGFNYLLTAKQSGISRPSIKRWESQHGKEVIKGISPLEELLMGIDGEMQQSERNILRRLYFLRKRTIQKIIDIADKETRVEVLISLLKFVSTEIDHLTEIESKTKVKMDGKAFIRSLYPIVNDTSK